MRSIIAVVTTIIVMFATAIPTYAQSGGIGDIFEDILRGPETYPSPGTAQAQIDNIPVSLFNEDGRDLTGHILILTAYAASPANVRVAEPQFLGETRILLSGLGDELQLVVAAPARITETIDAARLTARVVDGEDNIVLKSRDDGYYRGLDAPELVLISTSLESFKQVQTELLSGVAILPANAAPLPRGGKLRISLYETLAPYTLVTKTTLDIDQLESPFAFSLSHPQLAEEAHKNMVVSADILDWAGRRTHTAAAPLPYTGSNSAYQIALKDHDELAGSPVSPKPMPMGNSEIFGEVLFDAYKGLPPGAKLDIKLRRGDDTDRILDHQTIKLGRTSEPVQFKINNLSKSGLVQDSKFAVLDIRITDHKNRTLFSSQYIDAKNGFMSIRLRTDPRY